MNTEAAITAWNTRAPMPVTDAEVEAALKPFAAIADLYADAEYDDFQLHLDCHESDARVTLGMCRKARAALTAARNVKEG